MAGISPPTSIDPEVQAHWQSPNNLNEARPPQWAVIACQLPVVRDGISESTVWVDPPDAPTRQRSP